MDVNLDMDILADGLRMGCGAGGGWERLVRTCCDVLLWVLMG